MTTGQKIVDTVRVSINGQEVWVEEGITVLQAAREAAIYIPALCFWPGLQPVGEVEPDESIYRAGEVIENDGVGGEVQGCQLCLVEVEGEADLLTSCTTKVADGMVVWTDTDRVQKKRRENLLHLLTATAHPSICLTCDRAVGCPPFSLCVRSARVPNRCVYCPKYRDCELYDAAAHIGIMNVTVPYTPANLPIVKDQPFFVRDYNLCIGCLRCVRICREVRGVDALGFVFRDGKVVVGTKAPTFDESVCEFCGACVDACPCSALYAKSEKWKRAEQVITTTCPFCGVGCQMEVGVLKKHIVRVRGENTNTPNDGQLCVKGRFSLSFAESQDRLKAPLVRKGGELVPASWEEALALVAEKLPQYKGNNFALISSAKCTNEENYLAQKFGRLVMETNNIDHCARLCHASTVAALGAAFGSGAMTNSIEEIRDAGCILVIGSNTTEEHPVIALKIKEAKRRGAKLIVANPRWIDLCSLADIWLRHKPGSDVSLVLGMCQVIIKEKLLDVDFIKERCEGFEEFENSLHTFLLEEAASKAGLEASSIREAALLYAENSPSSIIYSMGITQHSHGTDNILSLANLAMLTGNVGRPSTGINPLRGQNNVQGACDMGALPEFFPGYQAAQDASTRKKFEDAWGRSLPAQEGLTVVEMFDAILEGKVKALYVIGENPYLSEPDGTRVVKALEKLDFLVVQDIFPSETARLAHVVLPAASALEKEGTFTNTERRVQRVRRVLDPAGESRPDGEIICEIAKRMGGEGFSYSSPSEIMDEVSRLVPIYGGISYERLDKAGLQWPCPDASHPGTSYLHRDQFSRGKGKFHVVDCRPSVELPDEEYPFLLTTGRGPFHFQTGTMTRRVAGLNQLRSEELLEISPEDARALGIGKGEIVEVSSRRGKVNVKARVTDRSPQGVVFMTFHFAEPATNVLTNPALDPVAKIPEFKVCAVKLSKIAK